MKKFFVSMGILALLSAGSVSAETYSIDTSHSEVEFSVFHMVISKVKGNFTEFSGTMERSGNDFKNWKVKGTINAGSISTDNEKRDAHLRSPDFFDTKKFPEITFESSKIVKNGDGYVAVGTFTMRGVSKAVQIPFTVTDTIQDPWGNSRFGLAAEWKINRQDYGVSWSKSMDNGGLVVSDDVGIELNIEFVHSPKK